MMASPGWLHPFPLFFKSREWDSKGADINRAVDKGKLSLDLTEVRHWGCGQDPVLPANG
jgi:hypothetical protein